MDNRKIIENYHTDICNLAEILSKLVNSYRLLIGGAAELNNIALSNKRDVKKAISRANELGKVIDNIIAVLEDSDKAYLNYCQLKSKVLVDEIKIESIQSELNPDSIIKK